MVGVYVSTSEESIEYLSLGRLIYLIDVIQNVMNAKN